MKKGVGCNTKNDLDLLRVWVAEYIALFQHPGSHRKRALAENELLNQALENSNTR